MEKPKSIFNVVLYVLFLIIVISILVFIVCSVNDDADTRNENLQTAVEDRIACAPLPILLSSEYELKTIQYNGSYQLISNITLSSLWEPITTEKPFCGTFDGNGYEINCSQAADEDGNFPGLFASAGDGCLIYNLILAGCSAKEGAVIQTLSENSSITLYRCAVEGENIPLKADNYFTLLKPHHVLNQNADQIMVGYQHPRKTCRGESGSVASYIHANDFELNSSVTLLWCDVIVTNREEN